MFIQHLKAFGAILALLALSACAAAPLTFSNQGELGGRYTVGPSAFYEKDLTTPRAASNDGKVFDQLIHQSIPAELKQRSILATPGEPSKELRFRICYFDGEVSLASTGCFPYQLNIGRAFKNATVVTEIWQGDKLISTSDPVYLDGTLSSQQDLANLAAKRTVEGLTKK